MKLITRANDGSEEKWLEIESPEEIKAIKFLRRAILDQIETQLKTVEEKEIAQEAVFDVFNCEGFGAFANYERLLITNLE